MFKNLEDWLDRKVRIEWEDNNADTNTYTLQSIDSVLRFILLSTDKGASWVNLKSVSSIRLAQ